MPEKVKSFLENNNLTGGDISVELLFKGIQDKAEGVEAFLQSMQSNEAGESVSVSNMFKMQLKMNDFSQLCELTTGMTAAMHAAKMSMTRNVKQ